MRKQADLASSVLVAEKGWNPAPAALSGGLDAMFCCPSKVRDGYSAVQECITLPDAFLKTMYISPWTLPVLALSS